MSGQTKLEPTSRCLTTKRFLSNASSSHANRRSTHAAFSSTQSSVMVIPDMHDLFHKLDSTDPRTIHASSVLVTRLEKCHNNLEDDLFKHVCLNNVDDHSPPSYLVDPPGAITMNHFTMERDMLNQGLDTSFETSSSADLSDLPSTLMQSSLGDLDSIPYTVSTPSVLVRNRYCNSPGPNHHHNSILGDSGIGDLSACDDDDDDDPNEACYSLPLGHHQGHQEANEDDYEDCEADRVPNDVIQFVSESTRRITGRLSDVVSVGDSDIDDIVDHEVRLASLCLPILQPPSIISSHNSDCLPPPSLSPEPLGNGICGSDSFFPLSVKHNSSDSTDELLCKNELISEEAADIDAVSVMVGSSPTSMPSVVNMSTSLSNVHNMGGNDISNASVVQHNLTLNGRLTLQKSSSCTPPPSLEDGHHCQTPTEPFTVYLVDNQSIPIVSRAMGPNITAANGTTTQPVPMVVDTLFRSSLTTSLTRTPPSLSATPSASYTGGCQTSDDTGVHLPPYDGQSVEREAALLLTATSPINSSAGTITQPPQPTPLPMNVFTKPCALLPSLAADHTMHCSSSAISNGAGGVVGNGLVLLPGDNNYNSSNTVDRGVFSSVFTNSLGNLMNGEFSTPQLLFTSSDSPQTGFYLKHSDSAPSNRPFRSTSINSVSPACSVSSENVCNSTHILCTVPTTRINGCLSSISGQSASVLLQTLPNIDNKCERNNSNGSNFLLVSPSASALSQPRYSPAVTGTMHPGISDCVDNSTLSYFSSLPATQKLDLQQASQQMLGGSSILAPHALIGNNSIASLDVLRGCQSGFPVNSGMTSSYNAAENVSSDTSKPTDMISMTNYSLAKCALPSGTCPSLNTGQMISLLPSTATTMTAACNQQPKKIFKSNASQFILTSQSKDPNDGSTGSRQWLNLPLQILNSLPHLRPGMSIVFNIKNNATNSTGLSTTAPASNGSIITLPLRGNLPASVGLLSNPATSVVTSHFGVSSKTVDAGVDCGTILLLPTSNGLLPLASHGFSTVSANKPHVVNDNNSSHVTTALLEPMISSSVAPGTPAVLNTSTSDILNKAVTNTALTSVMGSGFTPISNLLMTNATNSQCFGKINQPLGSNLFENINLGPLINNQTASRIGSSSTAVYATNITSTTTTTTTTMSSVPSSVATNHLLVLRSVSGSGQAIQVNSNQQLPVLATAHGSQQVTVPSVSSSTGGITLLLTQSIDQQRHIQQHQPQPVVVKPELTSFLLLPTVLPSQPSFSPATSISAVGVTKSLTNNNITNYASSSVSLSPSSTVGIPWPSGTVDADNLFCSRLPSPHAALLNSSFSRANIVTTSTIDALPATSSMLSAVVCPPPSHPPPLPTVCQTTQPCSLSTFSLPITILPTGLNGLSPATVLVASRWPSAISSSPVGGMTTSLTASFTPVIGSSTTGPSTAFLPSCIIGSTSSPPCLSHDHSSLSSPSASSFSSSSTPAVAAAVNLSFSSEPSASFTTATTGTASSGNSLTSASPLCTLTSLLSPICNSLGNSVIVNNLLANPPTRLSEETGSFTDGETLIAGNKRTVLPPADHLLAATCRVTAMSTPIASYPNRPSEAKYRRLASSFPVKRCETPDTSGMAITPAFSVANVTGVSDCLAPPVVGNFTGTASSLPTPAGRRRHQCPYCPKSCERKDNLQAHIRTHTGERPYPCRFCSKAFPQKDHLRAHIRTHTGEKPYRCPQCFKAFAQLGNLHRHVKTHRR